MFFIWRPWTSRHLYLLDKCRSLQEKLPRLQQVRAPQRFSLCLGVGLEQGLTVISSTGASGLAEAMALEERSNKRYYV